MSVLTGIYQPSAAVPAPVKPRVERPAEEAINLPARGTEAAVPEAEALLKPVEATAEAKGPAKASADEVRKAAEGLREQLVSLSSHALEINFREDSERYVVSVVDMRTGDEIRQIPDEKVLEISERLDQIRGMLFDSQG